MLQTRYGYSLGADGEIDVWFDADAWIFQASAAGPPGYWVAPLEDFVGPYQFRGPDQIRNHALRLKPEKLTEEDIRKLFPFRRFMGDTGVHLIPFLYLDNEAFIEGLGPLQGVNEDDDGTVKAALVAPLLDHAVDDPRNLDWFPHHLFVLLALATGNPVAVPWLELRDSTARLVSRIHYPFIGRPGRRAKAVIRESCRVGQLLSEASQAGFRPDDALLTAVKNAFRSLEDAKTTNVEEMVTKVAVALDSLCVHYGCDKQDLSKMLTSSASDVGTLIKWFSSEILALKQQYPDDAKVLDSIASRAANAAQREAAFGLAVSQLCQQMGLHDHEVLAAFSRRTLQGQDASWEFSVSSLRGAVIHRASCVPDFTPMEGYDLANHLRDILVRVLWKAVGYTGCYQPTMARSPIAGATSDWVKPGVTKMSHLLPHIVAENAGQN